MGYKLFSFMALYDMLWSRKVRWVFGPVLNSRHDSESIGKSRLKRADSMVENSKVPQRRFLMQELEPYWPGEPSCDFIRVERDGVRRGQRVRRLLSWRQLRLHEVYQAAPNRAASPQLGEWRRLTFQPKHGVIIVDEFLFVLFCSLL